MKKKLYILIFFIPILASCVDTLNSPPDNTPPFINIYSPLSDDTIQVGDNEIIYDASDDIGLKSFDLYVDSILVRNYPMNPNGSRPKIDLSFNENSIGKRISYYIIVTDVNNKTTKSNLFTNILVLKVNKPPIAPSNLNVLKILDYVVNVSWQDTSKYISGFELWRKIGSSGIYELRKKLTANTFNTNDTITSLNQTYYYKIRAFNEIGYSDFSNEVSYAPNGNTGSNINPPTNLVVKALSTKSILLSWQDNTSDENYFKIERRMESENFTTVGIVNANTTQFKDSTDRIFANTTYFYRVKVITPNDSAVSNEVSVLTPSYDLVAPSNFETTNFNSHTIKLNWQDNSKYETYTLIERKTNSNNNYEQIGKVSTDITEYYDSTVAFNQTYSYRIRITDGNYYSNYSNIQTIKVIQVNINSPSNLTAIKNIITNFVELSWNDNSNNETNFIIERKDSINATFSRLAVLPKNTVNYVDQSVTNGYYYTYRVIATDGITVSYSNEITISIP